MSGYINDTMVIWELRGSYPEVKHFEDIDIAELTRGDDEPMFLTLPIGQANVTSGNKRFYDEAWLAELERQTTEKRPVGIMGHLKESDLANEFPPEAIHWVGVQRVGEMLWGKGYVPPGEARERVRRYKATNKKLATSIFAKAEGVWDKAQGVLRMIARSLDLQQIDIGPADRVGIPGLAAIPLVTAEMQQSNEVMNMDKLQIIKEMTADDARLLPDSVQQAILANVPTPKEVGIVAELRGVVGADDGADLTAVVAELVKEQKAARQAAVDTRVTELVNEGIKIEDMRPLVIELVNAHNPQTREAAEAAYGRVVEMENVKSALAAYVKAAMGPNQGMPINNGNGAKVDDYFPVQGAK